ncbi:MAG TPA: SPFH domain-containing protein [Rhodanobacteraceae bacterium]|nr:SPFH domain-containing protein [Rhodanobacteraceae bacterium]
MLFQISLSLALLVFATLVVMSVKRIPEGQVYSMQRLGRPSRMLASGTHVVLPLLDRVVHKISLNGHALQLAETPLTDLHGAPRVEGLVYWQVLEPERADEVIDQAEDLIRRNTLEALCASPDPVAEPIPARNARLKQALNQHLRPRGVLVTRVDLKLAA